MKEGMMKIFLDTANLNEIKKAKALGLVDGVTTNPTLLAKEGEETETLIRKISEEVKGPVNVEVTGTTQEEMVKEAKVMARWGEEIVIKIPINLEGLKGGEGTLLRGNSDERDPCFFGQPGHSGGQSRSNLCLPVRGQAR